MTNKFMKGGIKGYTSLTNLASTAHSFFGATAKPQVWVGGRRTKKRHSRKTRHRRRKTNRRHR
jgi:hypothetical protein